MSDNVPLEPLEEDSRKVLVYIRNHTFCEPDDFRDGFALVEARMWDIIHDLEARRLIGVKRIRPHYKLYPI